MVEAHRLTDLPLFSALSEAERVALADFVDEVEVPDGQYVATKGDFAYEFFVVETGTAEVRTNGTRVAELGPGDFFGEIGLLVTGRRTADVVATSAMTLIALFDRNFRRLERTMPAFSDRIRSVLQQRLENAHSPD